MSRFDVMNSASSVYNFQTQAFLYSQQDAQLSQRDRAAGCIIVFAKSRRLEVELRDNILLIL